MASNGHGGPVKFGQTEGLRWLDQSPNEQTQTKYTVIELARADSGAFEESTFDLEKHGRPILGPVDGISIATELRLRGQAVPGSRVTIKFVDGRIAIYQQRTAGEIAEGKPACIYRSDQAV